MSKPFALTWDYRCPYAHIVHDHVVTGLRAGAQWDVQFLPFCLGQAHIAEGELDIWDRPTEDSGIAALQFAVSVRDNQPEKFLDLHVALFEYRHQSHGDLSDMTKISALATGLGVDVIAVATDMESRRPLDVIREEHTSYLKSHSVWGVPTFIVEDSAVFVRLLDRPNGDAQIAIKSIERILDNIEWSSLNEFKHTTVPR